MIGGKYRDFFLLMARIQNLKETDCSIITENKKKPKIFGYHPEEKGSFDLYGYIIHLNQFKQSPGVYLYTLQAGTIILTRKRTVIK